MKTTEDRVDGALWVIEKMARREEVRFTRGLCRRLVKTNQTPAAAKRKSMKIGFLLSRGAPRGADLQPFKKDLPLMRLPPQITVGHITGNPLVTYKLPQRGFPSHLVAISKIRANTSTHRASSSVSNTLPYTTSLATWPRGVFCFQFSVHTLASRFSNTSLVCCN